MRRPHGHFLGCCQSARRPSLDPGSLWGISPLLTCLSLSAAIRGCLSWSCFLRSPFYGDTEEPAQPGRPGEWVAGEPRAPHPHHPMPGGPGQPKRAPTFQGRFPHSGHRAMSRGAAYLWLPPHWGSSRGGAGAEATRRRAPSRASLQAGVRVRVSVRVCAGGGGTNKEPSKHGESVSSKAHKYSSRVLISPTHTHAHAAIPLGHRPPLARLTITKLLLLTARVGAGLGPEQEARNGPVHASCSLGSSRRVPFPGARVVQTGQPQRRRHAGVPRTLNLQTVLDRTGARGRGRPKGYIPAPGHAPGRGLFPAPLRPRVRYGAWVPPASTARTTTAPQPRFPDHLPGGARVPLRAPRTGFAAPSPQLGQHFELTLAGARRKLCGSAGTRPGELGSGVPGTERHESPPAAPIGKEADEREERRAGAQLFRLPLSCAGCPGCLRRPAHGPPAPGAPRSPPARALAPPAPADRRQGLYFLRRARLDLAGAAVKLCLGTMLIRQCPDGAGRGGRGRCREPAARPAPPARAHCVRPGDPARGTKVAAERSAKSRL